MKFIQSVFITFLLVLLSACISPNVHNDNRSLGEWTPKFSGCGGIFIDAKKGLLSVELEKENLRDDGQSRVLRAVFLGPDRSIIEDLSFLDHKEGQPLKLETYVDRPGIYAIMVTVSNDRYGENIVWRFRTNNDKYIIETSRGHKDQLHEEPIVLVNPEIQTDVCFLPQQGEFSILITDLPKSIETIDLKDAKDQLITQLEVINDTLFHYIEEGERAEIPWKLHFPKANAKIEIEGVTRWSTSSKSDFFNEYPGGAFWTPHMNSWFNLHENRWLITPYSHVTYNVLDLEQTAVFKIHNNSTTAKKFKLNLEFPDKKWDIKLSDREVKLDSNQEIEVVLTWKGSQKDRLVHLRATSDDFTTYSTLRAKIRKENDTSTLNMPIILKPYFHEKEQFGYSPNYPLNNQPYFNVDNKPYVLTDNSVLSYNNGKWNETIIGDLQSSIVSFDIEGDVYVLGRNNRERVLLHSSDNGQTFKSYNIPGKEGSSFDIEQFSGHNKIIGPPPVMKYTQTERDKQHFWRRHGTLELFIPKKTDNGIEWEEPILISDKCLGVSSHSGLPSSLVSFEDKIFMVWGEVSDVNISRKEIPGVPVYVSMYDKNIKKLTSPKLVGFGPPPNDIHNIPGITIDSEGFLHILTGTHGRPFQYAESLQPLNVHSWTEAVSLLNPNTPQSTQTYLGFVADQNNTLHTIFRYWQHNAEPFPDTHYARLAYMHKKPGEEWSDPQILVEAPLSHYSNFRHRLTIDREGRLFVSYDYWSTYWFYRNDRKYSERTLLVSSDGGQNWKLVLEDDIVS